MKRFKRIRIKVSFPLIYPCLHLIQTTSSNFAILLMRCYIKPQIYQYVNNGTSGFQLRLSQLSFEEIKNCSSPRLELWGVPTLILIWKSLANSKLYMVLCSWELNYKFTNLASFHCAIVPKWFLHIIFYWFLHIKMVPTYHILFKMSINVPLVST